jgi:membrane protein
MPKSDANNSYINDLQQASTAALWRLGGLTPWEVLVRSLAGFRRNHLDARAAQFAYYSMLAVAPLLILLIAAIAHLPLEGVLDSFLDGVGRTMPEQARDVIARQIDDIQVRSSVSLVSLALVVLAFAGSNLFLTMARGLNTAYGITERRRLWRVRALALAVTIAMFVMALTVVTMLVVGPMVSQTLVDQTDLPIPSYIVYRSVRWIVVSLGLLLSVSAVYALAPSARLKWRPFSPGSVVATSGWVVTSLGCRFYVAHLARHDQIYGTLGGVIVLMIWLYLTGSVLLLGGLIDSVIHRAEVKRNADNAWSGI